LKGNTLFEHHQHWFWSKNRNDLDRIIERNLEIWSFNSKILFILWWESKQNKIKNTSKNTKQFYIQTQKTFK
jgi:hypothetical protein